MWVLQVTQACPDYKRPRVDIGPLVFFETREQAVKAADAKYEQWFNNNYDAYGDPYYEDDENKGGDSPKFIKWRDAIKSGKISYMTDDAYMENATFHVFVQECKVAGPESASAEPASAEPSGGPPQKKAKTAVADVNDEPYELFIY